MKKIQSIKYLIAALLLLSVGACKKSYFDGINESPNQPNSVTPAVALPWSQVSISYAIGGDMSRISSIYMQYVTGARRQMQPYQSYIFTEDNFSNLWGNIYAGHMNNLNDQIKKCNEKKYVHYSGISKILMAYSIGMVTDCWGSAPYSEAFKAAEGLKPKYDSQDALYASMSKLIADGLADLNNSNGGDLKPTTDDLIYGGNVAKWKKFAYALSARFNIHLCKKDGSAAQKAIDAINAGAFTANADDAQITYGTTATNAAPWYQYIAQRDDIDFKGYFLDSMIKYVDPRLTICLDTTGYSKTKKASKLGNFYSAISAPVFLMTYSEQKFIEAEAYNRLGDATKAQAAFTAAITASMTKLGVSTANQTAYLSAKGTLTGSQSDMLRQIMMQKYFSMFLQPESWTDWRRTGIPELKANAGAVINEVPRRFLYPQSERTTNSANTPQANLLSPRLWWDQ